MLSWETSVSSIVCQREDEDDPWESDDYEFEEDDELDDFDDEDEGAEEDEYEEYEEEFEEEEDEPKHGRRASEWD